MAATRDAAPTRRGPPRSGAFGYPVAPGEIVYRGTLAGVNALGQAQRLQTAGTVAFIGLADHTVDNRNGAAASSDNKLVGERGCFALAVPGAVFANINAAVFATDDNTLTLNGGAAGAVQVGILSGIENGQTFVQLLGG